MFLGSAEGTRRAQGPRLQVEMVTGAVPVVGDIQPEYGRVYPNISKLWVFNFRDHIYS